MQLGIVFSSLIHIGTVVTLFSGYRALLSEGRFWPSAVVFGSELVVVTSVLAILCFIDIGSLPRQTIIAILGILLCLLVAGSWLVRQTQKFLINTRYFPDATSKRS